MELETLTSGLQDRAAKNRCAMGIMTKAPRAGHSKTRLSPALSPQEAADISRCFLRDTTAAIGALSQLDPFVVGVAIYTPAGSETEFAQLLPEGFKMIAQREGDLGARLSGATEDLFAVGFSAVCLLNSDSPTLPFRYLQDLTTFLKEPTDRVVIGPCTDGGYYVLGMRHPHTRLFEDITWSTGRVYTETIERSSEINLPAITLPLWYDVDDQNSLHRLLSELFPERANHEVPQGLHALYTKEFLGQILTGEGGSRIWPQTSTSVPTAGGTAISGQHSFDHSD
jgi:uncharacterized protein